LLDAKYDFDGEHRRWFTFGVPRGWDLFSALKALAAYGYAHDARFVRLLNLLLGCQDAQGQWQCVRSRVPGRLRKGIAPANGLRLMRFG